MKLSELTSPPGPAPGVADVVAQGRACYLGGDSAAPNPLDMELQSAIAKFTRGISPIGMSLAFHDWMAHLAVSPGKRSELAAWLTGRTVEWAQSVAEAALDGFRAVDVAGDVRFADPGWSGWPYNLLARAFVQTQEFWQRATTGVRGVSPHHAQVVNFTVRQWLDVASPVNFAWSNPEVLRAAADSRGRSFALGWAHWLEDASAQLQGARPAARAGAARPPFTVGADVALTPGKVVYRNHLVELIQYVPQTATVQPEPVLIIPSWIMKYYILDLSPHNSLVRYLVGQGHTVFMVSWRNPGAADRNLGMEDYLHSGVFEVLEQVDRIGGKAPLHALGYCLGGTLLSIAAAALHTGAQMSAGRLKTVTLLAAQTDFTDPGELGLFIDESELAFVDALMWEKGYLDGVHMTGSFQLLNSGDLVWSRMMREYLLGIRGVPNDLMAWNADTTRLPYRMHSEYLSRLFLHNDLAEGRYQVNCKTVALTDIDVPLFVVGTERDHVSPWRSVYKINLLTDAPIEFVLASGGHNAGIVSEPGHARRSYQHTPQRLPGGPYLSPDEWLRQAVRQEGSWWPRWHEWLLTHAEGEPVAPPPMGAGEALGDAPGRYVLAH